VLFNSLHFVLFFPLVVAGYFTLPARFRWVFLLLASYYFYMCWKAEYAILMGISTVVDYYAGLMMGRTSVQAKRRKYLLLSVVTNFSILFGFKYFNFLNDSMRTVFQSFNIFYGIPAFQVLLPVGISFYTFQALSYTIDVYRGQKEPETHLGIFALYVSFFPQLVAGPIERCQHLLPQLYERHTFDCSRAADGLRLMLWGYFKKLVIADRLSIYVEEVFNHPGVYHGAPVILAAYFFAFQVYCDFSGYSDIAIGSAQVMGYRLMDNFRRPYFAHSIPDFWKRWHISLTTWFKDYLYIPLGGNRVTRLRWQGNVFVVFLLSGLWHGANWTFVVWGALHGFYYLISYWTSAVRARITASLRLSRFPVLLRIGRVLFTFHLILLGCVFFRAYTLSDAMTLLGSMFVPRPEGQALNIILTRTDLLVASLSILFLMVIEFTEEIRPAGKEAVEKPLRSLYADRARWATWALGYAAAMAILMFGEFSSNPFIYFQF
jgi:D-alanyl-lipoteichoic acid acyltransferase DltB (MBOAT superfamily)